MLIDTIPITGMTHDPLRQLSKGGISVILPWKWTAGAIPARPRAAHKHQLKPMDLRTGHALTQAHHRHLGKRIGQETAGKMSRRTAAQLGCAVPCSIRVQLRVAAFRSHCMGREYTSARQKPARTVLQALLQPALTKAGDKKKKRVA